MVFWLIIDSDMIFMACVVVINLLGIMNRSVFKEYNVNFCGVNEMGVGSLVLHAR